MFGIGIKSNIPGEDGRKITAAMKEELDSIEASIRGVHGAEFANFIVPLSALIANIGQLINIASSSELSPGKRAFLGITIDAFAHQTMEIVMHRAVAFIQNNPNHKSIKTVPDFFEAYQNNSDMILNKLGEYINGKKA